MFHIITVIQTFEPLIKLRLFSKFMTSQAGQQAIAIHILLYILRRIGNQTMKFVQLEIFLFKNHAENETRELVPDLFLFFKKAIYKVKANGLHLSFTILRYSSTWTYNKSKRHETLKCWSGDMFNFDFLENCLGLISLPHFVNDFARKMFLILRSINWPNFIVLDNTCTVIVFYPFCNPINFEIYLRFLTKPFSYLIKN